MFDFYKTAMALIEAGRPFATAVVVRAERPTSARPGARAIITPDGRLRGWVGGSCAQPMVIRAALNTIRDGQARLLRLTPPEKIGLASQEGIEEVPLTCISGGTLEVYIEPNLPKAHLVAIGHLPIVESLATLGAGLGLRITVAGLEVDRDRFQQADVVLEHLDLSHLENDPQAYIVVASHGNYDEQALEAALKTKAAYIALVASRQRAREVLRFLQEMGYGEADLGRVKYPAGLDIGAQTPEEIALSILAEIVRERRRLPIPPVLGLDVLEQPPLQAVDLVCHMMVDVARARYHTTYQGEVYYFCSLGCQHTFEKNPEPYLEKKGRQDEI